MFSHRCWYERRVRSTYDGEEYFANKSDLVKWFRDQKVDEYNELSDEFLLKRLTPLRSTIGLSGMTRRTTNTR
jgi:hypothetical protein